MNRNEQSLDDLGRILLYLHAMRDEAGGISDQALWEWYEEGRALVMRQHVRLAAKMARERFPDAP